MNTVKIIKTDGMQAIIRVPVTVLIEKLGSQRADNLMNGSHSIYSCSDNWAGANVYSNCVGIEEYRSNHKTIKLLISGHHQGEYKSTVDYLTK